MIAKQDAPRATMPMPSPANIPDIICLLPFAAKTIEEIKAVWAARR